MWQRAINKSSGGGGGASIEYVGEFTSGSGTSANSIDLSTGTYARSDYAELTTDNFLVLLKRSGTTKTCDTGSVSGGSIGGWSAKASVTTKAHEYTPSTGIFKFYGGFGVTITQGSQRGSASGSLTYDVYVIKPGLSELAGI